MRRPPLPPGNIRARVESRAIARPEGLSKMKNSSTSLPTYVHTYIHTYLPTYIPTCLPTYIPMILASNSEGKLLSISLR